jgi:hypothetical protein
MMQICLVQIWFQPIRNGLNRKICFILPKSCWFVKIKLNAILLSTQNCLTGLHTSGFSTNLFVDDIRIVVFMLLQCRMHVTTACIKQSTGRKRTKPCRSECIVWANTEQSHFYPFSCAEDSGICWDMLQHFRLHETQDLEIPFFSTMAHCGKTNRSYAT